MEHIREEHKDGYAVVTIERPPVNALNSPAYFELYQVFYQIALSAETRVVILTGAGEKAFAAGADVREFLDFDSGTGMQFTAKNQHIREYLRSFPKPVICAVNGMALGGGCALAMCCDTRLAAEHATFSLSEINMGIVGAIPYAAGIISQGTARRLVYSGESITAEEALRVGLVDEVHPAADLMPRCEALARKMAGKPPLALARAKACMVYASEHLMADTAAFERRAIEALWGTEDKNEAVLAFLEKRPPSFRAR